jgi:hypothetical protein
MSLLFSVKQRNCSTASGNLWFLQEISKNSLNPWNYSLYKLLFPDTGTKMGFFSAISIKKLKKIKKSCPFAEISDFPVCSGN